MADAWYRAMSDDVEKVVAVVLAEAGEGKSRMREGEPQLDAGRPRKGQMCSRCGRG